MLLLLLLLLLRGLMFTFWSRCILMNQCYLLVYFSMIIESLLFGHAVGHQDSAGDSFTLIVQYFTRLVVLLNKLLDDL